MIKTRTWICIITLIFILAMVLTFFVNRKNSGRTVANVYVNGECVCSYDLSTVNEACKEEIVTDDGVNVLLIENGRISVCEADCKDRICVNTGFISNSRTPIVCLPHKLVIKIEKDSAMDMMDAVTR